MGTENIVRRIESWGQNLCRPSGTRVPLPLIPGTSVPGYPMSPLRGWSTIAAQSGVVFEMQSPA